MSYTSKYTGQEIDNKLDQVSLIDTNKVSKNGDSMTGTLSLPYLNIKRNNSVGFCQVFKDDVRTALFQQMTDSNQLHICQAPPGDDTNIEGYRFPVPDTELTANKWYDIITTKNLDKIYPVGAVYISANSTSPASLFGGTWTQIKDRFLLAAGDTYAAASTGGAATVTLTSDQMPSHTHTFTGSSATTSSNGAHTHDRGSMNITGTFRLIGDGGNAGVDARATGSGCITPINGTSSGSNVAASNWDCGQGFDFNAANNWTGSTSSNGAHTHTLAAKGTNSSTGGGESHNNMPPYLTLYMWRRTA